MAKEKLKAARNQKSKKGYSCKTLAAGVYQPIYGLKGTIQPPRCRSGAVKLRAEAITSE